MTEVERRFVQYHRVARLSTASADGEPHVVPVCFVLAESDFYVTIDAKPKRHPGRELKRERNIRENPRAAVIVDRYDEKWDRLGWVMLRGSAEVLTNEGEARRAQALLRERYPQYQAMVLEGLPVLAVRIDRVTSWGDLTTD